MKIPDEQQRRDAVLTEGHAFVWASAGTGKTHTLTLRALYLLLTGPFDRRAQGTECAQLYRSGTRADRLRAARAVLRRFVLTTFTRKAAAEMQVRLYSYLDAVAGAEDLEALEARFPRDAQLIEVVEAVLQKMGPAREPFAQLRQGAEALGELATELQVCTLHSFAMAILQRHPITAGIPHDAQFAEEDDATTLDVARQAVDRWWQKSLADPELCRELEKLIQVVPLADMRAWLEAVYEHRWVANKMDFGPPDAQALAAILAASERLAPALQAAGGKARKVALTGDELQTVLAGISARKRFAWSDFCAFLVERKDVLFNPRKAIVTQNAIASLGALRPHYEDFEVTYATVLQQCLAKEHATDWERWRRFVGAFAQWLDRSAISELGIVTFDDMVRLAARVLRDNAAVRREERERLWTVLVDEFQDTDPVQLDLLESLLGRQSESDHEVMGFFVGDQKQSIYRFRGADLPAIESFVNRFPKLARTSKPSTFRLTASFRSLPPITDFVNHFFQDRVPLPNHAAGRLQPVREGAGPKPEWRLLQLEAGRGRARQLRELAAWETARLIKEYRAQSGEADDKAYSDIVVLVRTHDELDTLLPVLEQAGIPVVSSGAKTFYQQPEVLDILNLLITAHNPQDTLAAAALLRSPLFGLSDVQIHRLVRDRPAPAWFHGEDALPPDLPAEARGRIGQMRRLVRARSSAPLAIWSRQVRGFLPVGLYARQNPEGRSAARIDQVLAAFRRAVELGAVPPLTWLLEQRDRARETFDPDFGEDVSVTDESMAAVRALTIHKAKGLQGKFVIVFGWQKALDKLAPESARTKTFHLTGPDGNPVCGFQFPWGRLRIASPHYAEALHLDHQYEAEEAKRLAYVTATRAEDRLVLLSPHTGQITSGLLTEAKSLLDDGGPSMLVYDRSLAVTVAPPPAPFQGAAGAGVRIKDGKAYAKLWRARLEALAIEPEPFLHKPSRPEHEAEEEEVDLPDYVREKIEASREQALETGTLTHRYLEKHLTDEEFDRAKLDQVVAESGRPLVSSGARETAGRVLSCFYGGHYHKRARAGRVEGREMPVFLTWEGKAWSGVMDLVLSEGGMIRGVDYKVMKQPPQLPAEYAQQQSVYTEALRRMFPGRNVAFEFWWLGQPTAS